MTTIVVLTKRQRDTILAALRCWQIDRDMQTESRHDVFLDRIAGDEPLSSQEIDVLYQRVDK